MKHYKLWIEDLDDKLEDGIPEKHIVMITGTPGTMKSSLSYNFLHKNAMKTGASALYLTLEQDQDSFMYQMYFSGHTTADHMSTHLRVRM